jgi:hypothetical protein
LSLERSIEGLTVHPGEAFVKASIIIDRTFGRDEGKRL